MSYVQLSGGTPPGRSSELEDEGGGIEKKAIRRLMDLISASDDPAYRYLYQADGAALFRWALRSSRSRPGMDEKRRRVGRGNVNPGRKDPGEEASDPGVSAWVSAHAGSGKTFLLVRRLLRLLLSGADPGKILCLAFTRAAAAEMSDRVLDRLAAWAGADDETLRRSIEEVIGPGGKVGGFRSEEEGLAFARSLLSRVLETPEGLGIRTFHGFCERLLHRFAFEAGAPPCFPGAR